MCGKIFLYQSQLQKHIDCAHRDGKDASKKVFQNRQCTPEFKKEVADFAKAHSYKEAANSYKISEGTVRRWVAFYHNTISCEDCGAVFAYEKELKKHQMLKHGEKYLQNDKGSNSDQIHSEMDQRRGMLEQLYAKKIEEEIAVRNEIEANMKAELAAKCVEVVCDDKKEVIVADNSDDFKEENDEMKLEHDAEIEPKQEVNEDEFVEEESFMEDISFKDVNNDDDFIDTELIVKNEEIYNNDQMGEIEETKVEVKNEPDDFEHSVAEPGGDLKQTIKRVKKASPEKPSKDKGEIKCQYCDKTFTCSYYLKRHIVCHTQEHNFPCDECDKKFRHRASLLKHKKMHQGIVYTCHLCGKVYAYPDGLNEHIKEKHLNPNGYIKPEDREKTAVCDHCGKAYHHNSDLTRHKIVKHTKEFPLKCDKCGLGFLSCKRKNYEKHITKCKGKSSGKISEWTCEQCGKVFNKKSNYQVHLKHHSQIKDFSCMSCGKSFFAKRALIMHTEKHHPENLSQFESDVIEECDQCQQTFNTKTKVWLHKIEEHGFEYPYRCNKCNEGFVRMDLKKGHKRICDGEVRH